MKDRNNINMIQNLTRKLCILTMLSFLSACGVYSSKFTSTPADGIFNLPMDEVDRLISANLLDEAIAEAKLIKKPVKIKQKNIWVK
jgi:hypothetical protein